MAMGFMQGSLSDLQPGESVPEANYRLSRMGLRLLQCGMMRRILIVISAVLNIGGLIGLFTLPEDVPVALQRLGAIATWFDRDTILFGLFGLSLLGFGWVILQPLVLRWLERRRVPPLKIDYPAGINSEGAYGVNKSSIQYVPRDPIKDDPTFGRVVVSHYFFDIKNTTARTIKNVSVIVHMVENPLQFPLERKLNTRSGETQFDISPGYTEFVQIGFSHRYANDGVAEHHKICELADIENLKSRWRHDPGFMLTTEGGGHLPLRKNNNLRMIIGVYADDVPPTHHKFTISCNDKVEIYYNGRVNPDERLEPRSQLNTASRR